MRSDRLTRVVGLVVPAAQVAVRAQVDGLIARRLKDIGEVVAAGGVVALIDDADLLLEREKLKARVAGISHRSAAASADLRLLEQRGQQLRVTQESRAAAGFEVAQSRCQIEAAAARVRALDEEHKEAEAECAVLERRVLHFRCVAPIAGEVSAAPRGAGEFVRAGETVLTIQSRRRQVRVNLPTPLAEQLPNLSFRLAGFALASNLAVSAARPEYNLNGGRSVALEIPSGVELEVGRTVDVEVVAP
jgi:multidrug efflux pump subunit AcrA (membrane-fusion protein)